MRDPPARLLILLVAGENDHNQSQEVRLARLAPPYYLFKDYDADVALASTSGGAPWIPVESADTQTENDPVVRFLADRAAREDLAETLSLDQIVASDFDAVFCVGFAGSMWGADCDPLTQFIKMFLQESKPVALIPGRALDLAPDGAGLGLLIIGDCHEAPIYAAHALLKVVDERRRRKENC